MFACLSIHRDIAFRIFIKIVSLEQEFYLFSSTLTQWSFRFKTNYFNKCLLQKVLFSLSFRSLRVQLNCERWNEFQVFNDHVHVSSHKYSMAFARKLSIKTEWNHIKKSIKISNFICFFCTLCELYGSQNIVANLFIANQLSRLWNSSSHIMSNNVSVIETFFLWFRTANFHIRNSIRILIAQI